MNQKIHFDPLTTKSPVGVVVKNTKIKYFINVNESISPSNVFLMMREDSEQDYFYHKMEKVQGGYLAEIKLKKAGHYFYNFKIELENDVLYLSKTFDNYSYVSSEKGEEFFQSVINKKYDCNNSMQGGLIYQIFVDRFCKKGEVIARDPLIYREDWGGKIKKNTTNPLIINLEVFGGNFAGIESKLGYLKELGVTVLYLNPIGMANSNHKYDTSDYMHVDPMFGSDKDFEKLVKKAKQKGIEVVFDGVYNHTGSDSIYFNRYNRFNTLGAYNSKDSKFYSWYDFINYPNEYQSWWGIDTLPSIKETSYDFQEYITGDDGVLDKYLKMGVKGVRLDVVDEITDEFVKKISNRVLKYNKNNVVMGEVWEDASTKESYSRRRKYFVDGELNSVMNYPVKESILSFIRDKNSYSLNSTMRMLVNGYPKSVLDNLMNFLSTHDTGRIFSDFLNIAGGNKELAIKFHKIASLLTYTLCGVPSIFYGDEYGMENNDDSSRGCFDWKNYKNEIFDWYKKMAELRKLKALKDGEFKVLYSNHGKFVFERVSNTERVIVLCNLENSPLQINLQGDFISFVTGKKVENINLKQNEFEVLIEKK